MSAVVINVKRRDGKICVTGPSGMETGMDGRPICVMDGDGWEERLSEALKNAHRIENRIDFVFTS